VVILLAFSAVASYPVALYPARAAYDWALMDTALALSRIIVVDELTGRVTVSPSAEVLVRTDQFDNIYYAVHDGNGMLIVGDGQLVPPEPRMLESGEALYDSRIGSESVRVAARYAQRGQQRFVVQVAETTVKRTTLVTQILSSMMLNEMLLVTAVIALLWIGIGRGLEPLQRLRKEIAARSYRDLRPVPVEHVPIEVQPVVSALNTLLAQLAAALQAQQQFVANAAHQLRTPLAGLRMQVEYGLQQSDPEEWRRSLEVMKQATERTARLANQLLTLARAEVGASQLQSIRPLDLSVIVQDLAGEWMPRTIAKKIDLGLELHAAPFSGDEVLIGEVIRNLLDNALRYTPNGRRITVRTWGEADNAVLEVEDDGPGIPHGERENVFRRFHRIDGSPGEGCGLGLAIVQEIAVLHGGHAEICTPVSGRGTAMVVRFSRSMRPAVDTMAH
jgi:two-component system sensor histidine kinase TctE